MASLNKKLSVLIVNDDPDDQFLFRSALEEINKFIDVNFIYTGRQLVEFLLKDELSRALNRQLFPDLVLAELNGTNLGLDLIAEVRNYDQFRGLPIYLFSSSDIESMEPKALEKGATGLYKIPCNFHDLKTVLLYILRKETS
jgi:CheY-like chemotaxis protein